MPDFAVDGPHYKSCRSKKTFNKLQKVLGRGHNTCYSSIMQVLFDVLPDITAAYAVGMTLCFSAYGIHLFYKAFTLPADEGDR